MGTQVSLDLEQGLACRVPFLDSDGMWIRSAQRVRPAGLQQQQEVAGTSRASPRCLVSTFTAHPNVHTPEYQGYIWIMLLQVKPLRSFLTYAAVGTSTINGCSLWHVFTVHPKALLSFSNAPPYKESNVVICCPSFPDTSLYIPTRECICLTEQIEVKCFPWIVRTFLFILTVLVPISPDDIWLSSNYCSFTLIFASCHPAVGLSQNCWACIQVLG